MKLLVGVDLSDSTQKVVVKAENLARRLSATVWLLHVAAPEPEFVGMDVGPQSVRNSMAKGLHGEHSQIHAISQRMRDAGIDATGLLVQGATIETILNEASKHDVDMIVLGSHGRGAVYRALVGSVSEGVLRKSARPVLLIPTRETA